MAIIGRFLYVVLERIGVRSPTSYYPIKTESGFSTGHWTFPDNNDDNNVVNYEDLTSSAFRLFNIFYH